MAMKPNRRSRLAGHSNKLAKKTTRLGTVEAPDAAAAIEKAAVEFKVDTWRLLAVARR
jgi:hypothetical protein